jgi:hypothetical protein
LKGGVYNIPPHGKRKAASTIIRQHNPEASTIIRQHNGFHFRLTAQQGLIFWEGSWDGF